VGINGAPFRLTLCATVLGFAGFALLFPVVPLWAARGGASAFGAGASTAALMFTTVVTQLATPWLLARVGHRWVLGAGLFLVGAPAPLLALSAAPAPVIALSAVRGIGFGLFTVAASAVVAELVPPEQHGRANAWFGAAIGVPQLALLAAGVAVVDLVGFPLVFALGGAAPVLGALLVPLVRMPPTRDRDEPSRSGGPLVARAGVGPLLAMLACSMAQGGLTTFLPLAVPDSAPVVAAALLAMSAAGLVGRVVTGVLVDRYRLRGRVVGPAALLVALGAGLEAAFVGVGAVGLVIGAALVGLGFGAVQNDALTALLAAYGPNRYGTASAAWNIAFDAGTGVGAIGLGALADPFGFRVAFGAVAVLCAATVMSAPRSAGRARRRPRAGAGRS
jgi:MFS family permease